MKTENLNQFLCCYFHNYLNCGVLISIDDDDGAAADAAAASCILLKFQNNVLEVRIDYYAQTDINDENVN